MTMTNYEPDPDQEFVLGPTFFEQPRYKDGQLVFRKRTKDTKPFVVEVKKPRIRRVFASDVP